MYIYFGKITAPHGVHGKFKIRSEFENYNLAAERGVFFDIEGNVLKIKLISRSGNQILGEMEGVVTRDQAGALRDLEVFVEPDILPDLTFNTEYYYYQLLHLKVYKGGKEIGKVVSVDNYGAGDILEVEPSASAKASVPNKANWLLPFDNDHIESVDVAEQKLTIRDPK